MGILVLVSLFERQVTILPDKGIKSRLPEKAMEDIIGAMTPGLKQKEVSRAMEAGLKQLSAILEGSAQGVPATTTENEIPDEIIEEKGV
jgi:uncharacterized membrane protein